MKPHTTWAGFLTQWKISLQSVRSRDHVERNRLSPDSEVRISSRRNAEIIVCPIARGLVRHMRSWAEYCAWATSLRFPVAEAIWIRDQASAYKHSRSVFSYALPMLVSSPSRIFNNSSIKIIEQWDEVLTIGLRVSLDRPGAPPAEQTSRAEVNSRWGISADATSLVYVEHQNQRMIFYISEFDILLWTSYITVMINLSFKLRGICHLQSYLGFELC